MNPGETWEDGWYRPGSVWEMELLREVLPVKRFQRRAEVWFTEDMTEVSGYNEHGQWCPVEVIQTRPGYVFRSPVPDVLLECLVREAYRVCALAGDDGYPALNADVQRVLRNWLQADPDDVLAILAMRALG